MRDRSLGSTAIKRTLAKFGGLRATLAAPRARSKINDSGKKEDPYVKSSCRMIILNGAMGSDRFDCCCPQGTGSEFRTWYQCFGQQDHCNDSRYSGPYSLESGQTLDLPGVNFSGSEYPGADANWKSAAVMRTMGHRDVKTAMHY